MNWWGTVSDIASVVESIFVAVSVVLIVVQLRKQTQLAQAANSQAAFELSSPFNLELIRDKDFARLWLQGPNLSDPVDQFRHESLVVWWLLLHENVFYQRKKGLLEEEAFLPWRQDLCNFSAREGVIAAWPKIQGLYQADFAAYLEEIILANTKARREAAPNSGPQPDDTASAVPHG